MNDNRHLNHEVLMTLQEIMEDEFTTLIETFLSDAKLRLTSMQRALALADSESLRFAAHSLKGSSSNIGAETLRAISQSIEAAAVNNELVGVEVQLIELLTEFNYVAAQLDTYR